MRPFRQGDLDGLCGVYAVINSLELVGAPLRRGQLREVFQQLTYSLGAASLLEAMQTGMDALTLLRAVELTFGWLAATYDVRLEAALPFEARRFRSAAGYLRALQEQVDAPGSAAVIAFKNRDTAHWSVVRRVDGADLHMRDSDGLVVLRTAGFAVNTGRRHFRPADTLVIQQAG